MKYPFARSPQELGFEKILYHKRDGVATVTINRPEVLNALDFQTLGEMSRALEDASWDDSIAVVVLTGAGERAFSTGADLEEQERFLEKPRDYWKWMGAFIEAQDRLRHIGKPSIARLNGMVVGGGNEFNIACDLAIAAEHAVLRHVGMARGSVAAAGATQWLPLLIGDRRAREMLFLCEEIPALKALEWGLINQVVPYAELDAAVAELAGKLIHKLPEVTRYTKVQANIWRELAWSMTIGHARDWLTLHAGAMEVEEGLRAFFEKREVDYLGQRRRVAEGGASEHPWGRYTKRCRNCGAEGLPADFEYCGRCGAKL